MWQLRINVDRPPQGVKLPFKIQDQAPNLEIEITIIELQGNKAKVVICADQAVSIVRKHLSVNG
jgi:hypothetical protein